MVPIKLFYRGAVVAISSDKKLGDGGESGVVVPRHVAIIMDGNGRWAKRRFLPRIEGHRNGAKSVRVVVEECRKRGVRYLTLFAFSTENWGRPVEEVSSLMGLFVQYLESELERLSNNGIRLRAMGDLGRLPDGVRERLRDCEAKTASNTGMDLILALSYGGRDELVNATRRIVQKVTSGELRAEDINESEVAANLYLSDVPDPELLIRTSDERRISNFMLWQLAYSEIVVTPVLWPDFNAVELQRCFVEFSARERRFGLTADQSK